MNAALARGAAHASGAAVASCSGRSHCSAHRPAGAPSNTWRPLHGGRCGVRDAVVTCAQRIDAKAALQGLRAGSAGSVDPAYVAAANYLRTMGFTNTAEIARILDVAMNPNSLFVTYSDRRSRNGLARLLDVEQDIQPVVEYLAQQGLKAQDVVAVVSAHPALLCYSVPGRLRPFFEYLASVGVPDVAAAVLKRPSLLGLEADEGLRKIVEYLQSVDTPPETIVKYLTTSI